MDETLRLRHQVPGYLVAANFSTNNGAARGGKGFAPTLMARCDHCRSIRRHHDVQESVRRRAAAFRRDHGVRWCSMGRTTSLADALLEMDTGGVTTGALEQLMLDHLNEECPGLCAFERDRRIVRHTIDRVSDMQLDVRDPSAPFSIENIGILCRSCNQSKRDTPWARWIHTRHAQLRAWQAAIDDPKRRGGEQLGLWPVA